MNECLLVEEELLMNEWMFIVKGELLLKVQTDSCQIK